VFWRRGAGSRGEKGSSIRPVGCVRVRNVRSECNPAADGGGASKHVTPLIRSWNSCHQMLSDGWGLEILGMAGYPWCDGAVPDRGDRRNCKKSGRIVFLRGSNYESRVFTQKLFLRKNYIFRKKSTFHVKGDL
jgi:hypothetical protein